MSILTQAFRSALAARSKPTVAPAPAEGTASLQQPAPDEAGGFPAWRLLSDQTGVQDIEYADISRPNVAQMFRQAPRRMLDIGCAGGAVGGALKASDPALWVWGCEPNARAAQIAARRLDHITTSPRAEWTPADLALLKSIDTVLLLDVLEHMYNPWAELEFLAKNLPSDSQVIVSLPNVGHLSVLQAIVAGRFPYFSTGILDVTHVRFFTYLEMDAMFVQTGFEVESVWILNGTPEVKIDKFPVQVDAGKVVLKVDSEEEWLRLHAIQFGFRLRPR